MHGQSKWITKMHCEDYFPVPAGSTISSVQLLLPLRRKVGGSEGSQKREELLISHYS